MMTYVPTKNEVDRLRSETGSGMMNVKDALVTARGDYADAKEILRTWGTSRLPVVLERIRKKQAPMTASDVLSQLLSEAEGHYKRGVLSEREAWRLVSGLLLLKSKNPSEMQTWLQEIVS